MIYSMIIPLRPFRRASMAVTSVTSKGQVTIPKSVRQQLGIREKRYIS